MRNETARREIESLDYYLQNYTDDYSEESHTAMMMAVKALEQEPCEDTAFWEWVPYDDDEHGDIVCSKCRAVEVECVWKYTAWAEIERIKYKHCPQCGAKITESEDKE